MNDEKPFVPAKEQKDAINTIYRNLQIIACAGAGKTEVITRRIANILESNHEVTPANIVAFTFTEKAAESMKERIAKVVGVADETYLDDMYIGTIHAFCKHILNQYTEKFRDFDVLDTVKNHLFVGRYYRECGIEDLGLNRKAYDIGLFLECIEKMIDDYDNSDKWTQKQRDVLEKYINCLYEHKYIDFTLMIFEALKQIDTNPDVKDYLSQIKYLVVDEYQDVNDLQEMLISRISETGANICVVGDDDQTIYQFRGSNADNMISFSKRYSNVCQVRLPTNYRCAPGIIDVADRVIRNNKRRLDKTMKSDKTTQADIKAMRFDGEEEQFVAIAAKIAELHASGTPYKKIAILVRKGKTIAPASWALQKAGIPFSSDSTERFFEGKYFLCFMATLKVFANPNKPELCEIWREIIDKDRISDGYKYLRKNTKGGRERLSNIFNGFIKEIGFFDGEPEDYEERCDDLECIIEMLDDCDSIYGDYQLTKRIDEALGFLEFQARRLYRHHVSEFEDNTDDRVQIMTIHKSKGLQFDTVFLPNLVKGEFPASDIGGRKYWHILGGVFEENKDKYKTDIEDERKLFYVAVTRAERNLYFTYDLTSKPISCFVREAAESKCLTIDRSDLIYEPVKKKTNRSGKSYSHDYGSSYTDRYSDSVDYENDSEQDALDEWEYQNTVNYIRNELLDYFGTACQFAPAAYGDLIRVQNMSDEEIIEVGISNGII